MSEIGREAGNKPIPAECPRCGHRFTVPAKVFLDGGSAPCPECGLEYTSDGTAGREIDKSLRGFQKSIEKLNKKMKRGIRFKF